MSVTAVGNSLLQSPLTQAVQNRFQQIQTQFQQLGQDLQAGNLTQARQDFATLSQNFANGPQSAATPSGGIAQALKTLGQDLQSGNLTAAQSDYAALQQSGPQATPHAHHHHHLIGDSDRQHQELTMLRQEFGTLGQALQSGNLSSAQQAYTTLQAALQHALPDFTATTGGTGASPTSTLNTVVNLNA